MNLAQALSIIGPVILAEYNEDPLAVKALLKFAKLAEYISLSADEVKKAGIAMITDAINHPTAFTWYSLPYVALQHQFHGKVPSPLPETYSSWHVTMGYVRKRF